MNNLFENSSTNDEFIMQQASKINGLKIYFDYISKDYENELVEMIDKNTWLSDLSRRVQHYGYKYDYKARRIDSSLFLGKIPSWLEVLSKELFNAGVIGFIPDQIIVNEYVDNQGIALHIDCEPCFEDCIVSLSLGGSCVMDFIKNKNSQSTTKISLLIPSRTLLVMKDESRYNWYHGIPSRKKDIFNGITYPRARRVSITFRKVIL